MMRETEQQYKKIRITVNGEPLGKELWIDKVTYAPVQILETAGPTETKMNAIVS
ncbi:hypothetical protein ABID47_005525 [Paenibacillus favisporus]|uniref:Uncharacterized protein n=1 Tax=Paenibacillus favisporus TaxID=221028 RepID=A0ABV2FAU6_9BACL